MLSVLSSRILGFELLKGYYESDSDFFQVFLECKEGAKGVFSVQEGYLFKGNRLCVPKCSSRELLVREAHGGGLAGHGRL